MSSTKRIAYIDALRGLVMFTVVYQHIAGFMGGADGHECVINEVMVSYFLAIFFYISGYVLYKKEISSIKGCIKLMGNKIKMLLIPLITFSLIYSTIFYPRTKVFAGEYWFLLVLLIFYFLYYFISAISYKKESVKWWLLCSFSIIFVICKILYVGVQWEYYDRLYLGNIFIYFPFFVLGVLSRRFKTYKVAILSNNCLNTIAIVVYVLSLIVVRNIDVPDKILSGLRLIVMLYSGSYIVLSLFYRYRDYFAENGNVSKAMQYIGRHTLDIYMLHYFFIDFGGALAGKIHNLGYLPLEFFGIGILALMNIALSLVLSQCIRNSKFLAKYLFGARTA